jgi:hypothetical protein
MPIISDDSGTYTIGPDGRREYGNTTQMKVNDTILYDFNPETGELAIAADEQSIAYLIQSYGGIDKMSKVTLPSPFGIGGPARFQGVKSIRSTGTSLITIGPPKLEERVEQVEEQARHPQAVPEPEPRKSPLRRLMDYFR